jgi:hypothetical protein
MPEQSACCAYRLCFGTQATPAGLQPAEPAEVKNTGETGARAGAPRTRVELGAFLVLVPPVFQLGGEALTNWEGEGRRRLEGGKPYKVPIHRRGPTSLRLLLPLSRPVIGQISALRVDHATE